MSSTAWLLARVELNEYFAHYAHFGFYDIERFYGFEIFYYGRHVFLETLGFAAFHFRRNYFVPFLVYGVRASFHFFVGAHLV